MSESAWLLDTDVVSELAHPRPSENVQAFVSRLDRFIVASVVVFELERGVALLPSGKRKKDLATWLESWLSGPVVVVDLDLAGARAAARIEANAHRRGRAMGARDALILGTAESAALGVATRNLTHFAGHGVRTIDPFV